MGLRKPAITGAIALAGMASVAAFAGVAGWWGDARLSPAHFVDTFEGGSVKFPGFRRNHAKGICVEGTFESSGAAAGVSKAQVFAAGTSPVIGRFSLPGGNPHVADGAVPVRSLALEFQQADGQKWRTAMLNAPVFSVTTPEAFLEQLEAGAPDPATGKPDPARKAAFAAAHPEGGAFRQWASSTLPSASYATETYSSLNAFYLIAHDGTRRAARWRFVPLDNAAPGEKAGDEIALTADLGKRLSRGPVRWRLDLVIAAPGDPTNDATKAWPDDRATIAAGVLALAEMQPEKEGACGPVNFDPLVLPTGIAPSDDPLLAARSAVYANSQERRLIEGQREGKAS